MWSRSKRLDFIKARIMRCIHSCFCCLLQGYKTGIYLVVLATRLVSHHCSLGYFRKNGVKSNHHPHIMKKKSSLFYQQYLFLICLQPKIMEAEQSPSTVSIPILIHAHKITHKLLKTFFLLPNRLTDQPIYQS